MAERDKPMTSEEVAACLDTNAVVVRRTFAGLREADIVTAGRGHGGGWTLARPLSEISLLDVHRALGEPVLFQIGHASESPGCLVERAVNRALDGAMREAETILVQRLSTISLADIAGDFHARTCAFGTTPLQAG
jgi:DNA-binding IscR family transcriptional regulator